MKKTEKAFKNRRFEDKISSKHLRIDWVVFFGFSY